MLFNSQIFLFLFLPIFLFVYYAILKSKRSRLIFLCLASYIFYATWNYKFVALLFFSTSVDYFAGIYIEHYKNEILKKKVALYCSLISNLTILGFFKYYNFFVESFLTTINQLGLDFEPHLLNIILPVGISFYTFQSMSYTIDVYRNQISSTKDYFEFAGYVSLFPQLVAGPIIRYADIQEQLARIGNRVIPENIYFGFQLFILGLAKKVVIADSFAKYINPMFDSSIYLSSFEAWIAVIGYTFQLYFDFSGYSDMAIGLGAMIGLKFLKNFNSPYKALNPSDFWRRWHISLSTWLRDYLYIPLGGNKSNRYINVIVVFALGGLWHGANLTFLIWGFYHAGITILYFLTNKYWDMVWTPLQRAFTFFLVVIGWTIFRAEDLSTVSVLLKKMFFLQPHIIGNIGWINFMVILCMELLALIFVNMTPNTNEIKLTINKRHTCLLALIFYICILTIQGGNLDFLYYQF